MSRLAQLLSVYAEKPRRLVLGLHSGTSADGIMAALVRIGGSQVNATAKLVRSESYPYPDEFRARVVELFARETATVPKFGQAHVYLGELFARAAFNLVEAEGVRIDEVDAIACSGQIGFHVRRGQDSRDIWLGSDVIPAGLDLGEGAVIAERTGRPVVTNMRSRDMAAGGQGNPLVTYGDWVLFRHPERTRTVLNIGGIANPTVLPCGAGLDRVIAFDTGPGNMIIDSMTRHYSGGAHEYDADGAWAASGRVDEGLVSWLMTHEYVRRAPPKATGREVFGRPMTESLLQHLSERPLKPEDVLASVTAFTAASVAYNYRTFILPSLKVDEVLVCGGGAHNATLMATLRDYLSPLRVGTTADAGIPADAREVSCVAIIGNETMLGEPGNVPSATGAARRVVMGQITPPW